MSSGARSLKAPVSVSVSITNLINNSLSKKIFLSQNLFSIDKVRFLIRERKNLNKCKCKQKLFIYCLTFNVYISSLYYYFDNSFLFEYNNIYYKISFFENYIVILRR